MSNFYELHKFKFFNNSRTFKKYINLAVTSVLNVSYILPVLNLPVVNECSFHLKRNGKILKIVEIFSRNRVLKRSSWRIDHCS